ncbi:hypothetical protein GOP47_0015024 [Adiantum capillus-veneris]|uniref:PPM-type phosphatase domain-containing protein n=1 Tax=Adiantum capillus-veneris TaxID=13818 RepID=A0A9D4UNA3_ADICA|nr:hypothetical protein GOP47_0015024 [Adiantum capillus-veneris]
MCDCLSFFMLSWRTLWQRIYARWCSLTFRIVPAEHVQLLNAASSGSLRSRSNQHLMKVRGFTRSYSDELCITTVGNGLCITHQQSESKDFVEKQPKKEASTSFSDTLSSHLPSGTKSVASLFIKHGQKGVNQDAMLFIEDFAARAGTIFCGVFDGHGPLGHLVARTVIDVLPMKLAACWQSIFEMSKRPLSSLVGVDVTIKHFITDTDTIQAWKNSLVEAYKLMEWELIMNNRLDCVSSGTTAVTLVKQVGTCVHVALRKACSFDMASEY